jgi:hypothetical protein
LDLKWNVPICKPGKSTPPVIPPLTNQCKIPTMDLTQITVNENCRKKQVERETFCSFTCKIGFFEDTALDSFISQCVSHSWANEPKSGSSVGLLSKETLRCYAKCRSLEVVGNFNLLQNCLNNIGYNHGKRCTINCITGVLSFINVPSLEVECNDGSWIQSGNMPLSFELKCVDSRTAIPSQPVIRENCVPFSTDDELSKSCQMINGKEECIAWCPFGAIKHYNKVKLRLTCERSNWVVSYLNQESVYQTTPFHHLLECSR